MIQYKGMRNARHQFCVDKSFYFTLSDKDMDDLSRMIDDIQTMDCQSVTDQDINRIFHSQRRMNSTYK